MGGATGCVKYANARHERQKTKTKKDCKGVNH